LTRNLTISGGHAMDSSAYSQQQQQQQQRRALAGSQYASQQQRSFSSSEEEFQQQLLAAQAQAAGSGGVATVTAGSDYDGELRRFVQFASTPFLPALYLCSISEIPDSIYPLISISSSIFKKPSLPYFPL